jgi:putative aminopeptidase
MGARDRAVVDSAGNVVLGMGPDRDSVAFIAHMDEVAFEIERMGANGMLTLSPRGGAVTTAWEGTPALLHFDPGADGRSREPLRGVIVARDSGRLKAPGALTAWFGMDLEQLTARGVKPGMGITSYKRAARLAGFRVTARANDDRAGSAALLAALLRIDTTRLTHKVIFVWSVQEEGGLNGARAFGDKHGAFLQRVYSVDTFVSSDTPLESPHFAWATRQWCGFARPG